MLGKMVRRNYAQIRTLIPGSAHMARSMVNCAQLEKIAGFFTRFYCMNEEKILIDLIFSGKNFASTKLAICAFSGGGKGGDPEIWWGIYPPEKTHLTMDLAMCSSEHFL